MRKSFFIIYSMLVIISMSLYSPSYGQRNNPSWIQDAILYQIYPSSYQDSDGNGIGDIKGVQSRLDYIKSIGVNAIWFSPLFKSAFQDGGYDVIDFYQVDPRFGTNSDMVAFVEAAHSCGIRVMFDLVAGHSSDQCIWFEQSKQKDKNLQYSDYYIWASEKPDDITQAEASKWVSTDAPRGKYYIKNFYDCQPALNYGYANPNPNHPWEQPVDAPGPMAVRQELKNIISFWMNKGVDGFRVDLASSLVKNDPDKSATIKLWQDITSWFGEEFPEGVLLAEWFNPKQSISGGFHIDFFRGGSLTSAPRGGNGNQSPYFNSEGKGMVSDWYESFKDQYDNTVGKGYIASPTGSHDGLRLANDTRSNPEELKVAMTFFMMLPGVPTLYYGDEIGMKFLNGMPDVEGSRTRSGSRTPMQWDDSKNAGFSSAPENEIYLPLDNGENRPTVASQEKEESSLLNYVRSLLEVRKSSEALGNDGDWKLLSNPDKPYPLLLMRYDGSEKYIIAVNPSGKKVDASFSLDDASKEVSFVIGNTTKCSFQINKGNGMIKMPAISAAVYKVE